MAKFLRVNCCIATIFFLLATAFRLEAQSFSAVLEMHTSKELSQQFSEYQVFKFDANTLDAYVKSEAESPAQLKVGTHQWRLDLSPNPIIAEGYTLQVQTPKGLVISHTRPNIAFKGYELNGSGMVRLTLNGEFMFGFVEEGSERFYIEPLWYYEPKASRDLFVLYPRSAVSPMAPDACGLTEEQMQLQHLEDEADAKGYGHGAENSACYELDLAIASDRKMFDKYGSVPGVENHNIAVINDVEGDYTGSFNHDLDFIIVTQFVVTGTDPWTPSTDAGTLLGSFRDWGNGGNFGVAFDIGELWTNRDFDGGTVGIAYLNGVCNNNKYHCLQDFTNNQSWLRCMTSHEIGHNFSSGHDAPNSGFIMAPAVSSSTTWSDASQNAINAYMQSKINSGCLTACGPPPPPLVAGFDWAPKPACQGQAVAFSDQSTGNITGWAWTFPGGIPATSSQQNPSVTWNSPGPKSVTLTITGQGGSNTLTQTVDVNPLPVANFTYSVNGLVVTFTNSSMNATSYEWNFGDGGSSFDSDPVYEYPLAGTYVVVLTATNACGTSTKSLIVNTAPTADFEANPTSGCAALVVTMDNQSSSNATSFTWTFPGGAPSSSNQANPTVVYPIAGTYSITLKATNGSGSHTFTRTNYITVKTTPTANFSSVVNGSTTTFTNLTIGNATSYLWNFGDGNTSTQTNPVHVYANPGTYDVVLTATNECGTTSKTKSVEVVSSGPPTAAFAANPSTGCLTANPVPAYDHIVVVMGGNNGTGAILGNANAPYLNALAANGARFSNSFDIFHPSQPDYLALYSGSNQGVNNDLPIPAAFTTANLGRELMDAQKSYRTYAEGLPSVGFNGQVSGNYSRIHNPAANWMGTGVNQIPATTNQPFTAFPSNFDSLPNVSFVIPDLCSGGHQTCPPVNNSVVQFDTWLQNNLDAYKQWCVNNNSLLIVIYDEDASSAPNKIATVFYGAQVVNGVYNQSINHYNVLRTIEEAFRLPTHAGAAASVSPIDNCWNPAVPSLTVNFNNSSSGASGYSWQFPGGNPSSSTLANPSVVYSAAGTYVATLIASNLNGSDTSSTTITVNTVPSSAFNYAVSADTSLAFTNLSVGATSYEWNFGDGQSSTLQNPVHNYPALDSNYVYQVVLQATNDCGTVNDTQLVTIVTKPHASFAATPTSGCAPFAVQFNNTSSPNAASYQWLFPGGTPNSSFLSDPVVTYNAPGTYSATLIAINASGRDTFVEANYIVASTTPTPGFTSSANGLTASFTNTSTGATSYSWDFGDGGNSTAANPSHTYATDGTYTVVLSAINACGTVTSTQTVTVATAPTAGFTASSTSGCAPLTVDFTNTSSANATAWDWQFPGGNPTSSNQQNPSSVQYNLPGIYTVTLTVSNAAGSSTTTQVVVVEGGPTANFNSSVNGLTATFSNASSSNSLTYEWDFGDGNGSTEANPTHDYAADGTYTVVLTASNNCGSATFTQNVVITTAPGAGFSANTTSGCAVMTINFTDISSGNPVSWEWQFPGGTPSSSHDQNPTVQYFTPGVYDVTLIVTSIGGSTSSFTQPNFITVNGAPDAGFTSTSNGATFDFVNTSNNATSYVWSFGDGINSIEEHPTHTYANDGVYNVTLVATNNCGSTIFEQTVTVVTPPVAGFNASSNSGCAPFAVQFTNASSSNATSYAWEFPGGSPSASIEENPLVTWNTAGVYVVTLTASNAAGSSTSTATITVGAEPVAGFTYQVGGLTAVFTNTSTDGVSYSWDFGDGSNPSTEADPNHTYAQAGAYVVTLSVTNACGTVTITQTVDIQGTPPVPAISADNSNGCAPLTVQFHDESAGDPTSWNWIFPGGTPGGSNLENPVVVYGTPGVYDVVLEVTNGFGTSTHIFPAYITVLAAPTTNFTFAANQTTVSFASTSQNATSFAWDFGDGSSSNEENPTHTYAAAGTYTVTLAATNSCGTTIFQQTITLSSGTGEASWIQGFRLYPNPNSGAFTVEMQGLPQDEVEFILFNALGQQIKRETADFGTGAMLRLFDYGDLAAGVYALKIQAAGQAKFVKVTIGR